MSTAAVACETCLRTLRAGQTACSAHPHATLLRLDRSADREWLEIMRSQRRQKRINMLSIGVLVAEVLFFAVVAINSSWFVMLTLLPFCMFLTLTLYIMVQSFFEGHRSRKASSEAQDSDLLPALTEHIDTSGLSQQLRAARRDRNIVRSNAREPLSKSRWVSSG